MLQQATKNKYYTDHKKKRDRSLKRIIWHQRFWLPFWTVFSSLKGRQSSIMKTLTIQREVALYCPTSFNVLLSEILIISKYRAFAPDYVTAWWFLTFWWLRTCLSRHDDTSTLCWAEWMFFYTEDCEVSFAFLFISLCCLKPNDCFNFSLQRSVVQNVDNWRLWSGEIMFTPQILGKLVHLCFFL